MYKLKALHEPLNTCPDCGHGRYACHYCPKCKLCPSCKEPLVYIDDFCALACKKCNEWLDPNCGMERCDYNCTKRPEKPFIKEELK